jgi:hypothetical protein
MTAEEAVALPVGVLLYKGQGKRRETYVVEGKDGKQIWLRARRLLGQAKLVTGEYRDHHFWKDVRRVGGFLNGRTNTCSGQRAPRSGGSRQSRITQGWTYSFQR